MARRRMGNGEVCISARGAIFPGCPSIQDDGKKARGTVRWSSRATPAGSQRKACRNRRKPSSPTLHAEIITASSPSATELALSSSRAISSPGGAAELSSSSIPILAPCSNIAPTTAMMSPCRTPPLATSQQPHRGRRWNGRRLAVCPPWMNPAQALQRPRLHGGVPPQAGSPLSGLSDSRLRDYRATLRRGYLREKGDGYRFRPGCT